MKKITKANLESYDHDALKDEVNLLRSCDWPHIIKFKEFYDEKEYYYLITEVVRHISGRAPSFFLVSDRFFCCFS